MFTAFLDDSGTAPDQQVAIATAIIVPVKRIPLLESEWRNFSEKYEFDCFHTAEFAARNPKSEFAKWTEEKQDKCAERVVQIARKFGSNACSVAVNRSDYNELVPAEYRKHAGSHYTFAVRSLVSWLDRWAITTNTESPFEYVFDWLEVGCPARREIETVMAQAESIAIEQGLPGRYINYSFKKRCKLPGLQCSDAVAWSSYQQALKAFVQTPLKPIANKLWDSFEKQRGSDRRPWQIAVGMERSKLIQWINREMADGRSIERFRAWQVQHSDGCVAKGSSRRTKVEAGRREESNEAKPKKWRLV